MSQSSKMSIGLRSLCRILNWTRIAFHTLIMKKLYSITKTSMLHFTTKNLDMQINILVRVSNANCQQSLSLGHFEQQIRSNDGSLDKSCCRLPGSCQTVVPSYKIVNIFFFFYIIGYLGEASLQPKNTFWHKF